MLSANSSTPKNSANGLGRIWDVFSLEWPRHQVWLFLMSSLLLMIEPFVIYLLALDDPTGPTKEMIVEMPQMGNPLQQILHLFFVGPMFMIGTIALSRQLFSFLQDKRDSDRVLSLPFSRSTLFWGKTLCGAILLAIPLVLDALVLQFVLADALSWQLDLLRIYLVSLTLFFGMLVFQSRNGRYFQSLLEAASLFLFIPLLTVLMILYAVGSRPNAFLAHFTEWISYPISHINVFLSPILSYFLPKPLFDFAIVRIISLLFFGCWAWFQFIRRPGERSGFVPEARKHLNLQEIVIVFVLWMMGGFFLELLTETLTVVAFVAAFVLFALPAAFAVMHLRYRKVLVKRVALLLAVCFVCMLLFQAACFLLPVNDSRLADTQEIEQMTIDNMRLGRGGSLHLNRFYYGSPFSRLTVNLDSENDKEEIEAVRELCQLDLGPYRSVPGVFNRGQDKERRELVEEYSYPNYSLGRPNLAKIEVRYKEGGNGVYFIPTGFNSEKDFAKAVKSAETIRAIYEPERLLGKPKAVTIDLNFLGRSKVDFPKLEKHEFVKSVERDVNDEEEIFNIVLSEKGMDTLYQAFLDHGKLYSDSTYFNSGIDTNLQYFQMILEYEEVRLPIREGSISGVPVKEVEDDILEHGLNLQYEQLVFDPALRDFLHQMMPKDFAAMRDEERGESND